MISDLWKIFLPGGTTKVTLASLGIENPRLELANFDDSFLTFQVRVASINTACAFTYGAQYILYRDDVVFFVGRARLISASLRQGAQFWSVSIHDVWWEYERMMYRQPTAFYDAGLDKILGYSTTKVTLGQDSWGGVQTLNAAFTSALTFAQTLANSAFTFGTIPTLQTFPKEETREITIAEFMRRGVTLQPHLSGFFAYSSGTPVFSIGERADLAAVSLDLNDANLIIEVSELRGRPDMQPSGVQFDFLRSTTDGGGDARNGLVSRQSAGNPYGVGGIVASFTLGTYETVAANTALAYYVSRSVRQYEGTILLQEEECTGTVRPGKVLNLTNGATEWATMNAAVQRVSLDLAAGITTIILGPPESASAEDFVANMTRLRGWSGNTGFAEIQHNGTEGYGDGADGDPAGTEGAPAIGVSGGFGPGAAPGSGGAPAGGGGGTTAPNTILAFAPSIDPDPRIAQILVSLNAATIEATCNVVDSTIGVTLTLPSLPAS